MHDHIRKSIIDVLVVVVVAIILSMILMMMFTGSQSTERVGFDNSSLVAPEIVDDPAIVKIDHGAVSAQVDLSVEVAWTVTPIYSEYGGVADANITNMGSTEIYVYSIGVVWSDDSVQTWRNASSYVRSGETVDLGLIFFEAPSGSSASYSLCVKAEVAQNLAGTVWIDAGEKSTQLKQTTLESTMSYQNHTTEVNTDYYYSKVNKRVDFDAVSTLASNILANNSGVYTIQCIADAYDWVYTHITYVADKYDYWQSATETMNLRTGDCEDQAILLASIIGAMGGNAQIIVISEHAFPLVYVGGSDLNLSAVQDAISSHYHTDLPVCFLKESTGYWMVIDTTGFPYAGGLATLCAPVLGDANNSWTFKDSSWMARVDATGTTSGSSWPELTMAISRDELIGQLIEQMKAGAFVG